MNLDWTTVLAALGGGALGAAFGALPAFIFTGFAVIAGVTIAAAGGGSQFLTDVAFGPVFGPHISFAGGAAAAGYAAMRGYHANGRDIATPLMGVDRGDVLFVGGIFGCLGYIANEFFRTAGLGGWTDTIALTVTVSAFAARAAFGKSGLFGTPPPDARRFRPDADCNWLPWQQRLPQLITIGLTVGLLSAYMGVRLGPERGGAVIGFGIVSALLIFVQLGLKGPVTHHIALPAAAAALMGGGILAGAVAGIVGALVGEGCARLFLIHGDTHIDPPAAAIATMIFLLKIGEAAGLF